MSDLMSFKPREHACVDYLSGLRGRQIGDTIPCRCGRQFTLRRLTLALRLMLWRGVFAHNSVDRLWVRNKAAERADRQMRAERHQADRRPCRDYTPSMDGEQ